MNMYPHSRIRTLRAGFSITVFLFLCGTLFVQPQSVFAHGEKKQSHDMENLEKKPEGMIKFQKEKKTDDAASDYMQEPPQGNMEGHGEQMDMDHGDMGGSQDPFRTRGAHDALGESRGRERLTKDQALLARGKNIFMHMCVFCHGKDGNGGGVATEFLYPWPRDFRKGIFKFRSTPTNTLPRDEDIYRTIIKGVPNTSMPAWGDALSPQDTWALVNLIKSFSERFRKEPPGEKIKMNPPPPSSPEAVARGQKIYMKSQCFKCHGVSGKGDGELAESLMDAWKHAVFVHDITHPAYFKRGYSPEDIFTTLSTGLDGTPMESFAQLPEQDRWDLVHFVRSRFAEDVKQAEFETDVYSQTVGVELSTDINSPVWEGVKTKDLVLRPLSARRGAVETINFSSVNNGEQLAIRLRWEDPIPNRYKNRSDVYSDGAAVQFALGNVTLHTHGHNEPFFGMGNRGKAVNIWYFRAGQEEQLVAQEDQEYATGGVDMDALIFGGVFSNPVANLNITGENPIQELNAEGFGTVTPQPPENQNVEGYGEWKDGVWTVVFLRDMFANQKWDVDLLQTDPVLIAFAVWDGEREDRNGRKVVSVWQRLNIVMSNQ